MLAAQGYAEARTRLTTMELNNGIRRYIFEIYFTSTSRVNLKALSCDTTKLQMKNGNELLFSYNIALGAFLASSAATSP